MKRTFLFFVLATLAIVFSASNAFAQENEAILTTTLTYPDTLVSSVVAAQNGLPILVTQKDSISTEVLNTLNQFNITTIYIIGGPAVVSEKVENDLKNLNYNVVRIWGMTRFGTACEVAKYFWPNGSEEAVIVWDQLDKPIQNLENAQLVAQAKEIAISEKVPLLLVPKNTMPAEVADTLKFLNVMRVTIVGDVGQAVKDELSNLGITIKDEITGNITEIANRVRNKVMEKLRNLKDKRLIVIAVGNWTDVCSAPYAPGNSSVRLISSEDQIQQLIDEINSMNYTYVKVLGKPELATKICEAIGNQTNVKPYCPTIRGIIENVADLMRENRERIQERRRIVYAFRERIQEAIRTRLWEELTKCKTKYNVTISIIDKIENRTKLVNKTEIISELENYTKNLGKALDENKPSEALRWCKALIHIEEYLKWKYLSIEDEIEREERNLSAYREKVSEVMQKLQELRQKLANIRTQAAIRCEEEVNKTIKLVENKEYARAAENLEFVSLLCRLVATPTINVTVETIEEISQKPLPTIPKVPLEEATVEKVAREFIIAYFVEGDVNKSLNMLVDIDKPLSEECKQKFREIFRLTELPVNYTINVKKVENCTSSSEYMNMQRSFGFQMTNFPCLVVTYDFTATYPSGNSMNMTDNTLALVKVNNEWKVQIICRILLSLPSPPSA